MQMAWPMAHFSRLVLVTVMLGLSIPAMAAQVVAHTLAVTVSPPDHTITATDTLRFDAPVTRVGFALHRNLAIAEAPGVTLHRVDNGRCGAAAQVPHARCYEAILPAPADTLTLRYTGVIHHPLAQYESEIRTSEGTPGIIAEQGIFLDGGSLWYPVTRGLVSFTLDVQVPFPGWDIVSQGQRTLHQKGDTGTRVVWQANDPQEDIYLVGGKYHEYATRAEEVDIQVFLRAPERDLAERYLTAGAKYLALYAQMLGPYAFPKFAVVENFWDTGYGMPSFTLLGSNVIRFPFILHSSYPHEILHNWFGNGVYVDYASGNWSEGLTAYLADHLVQEQRGEGAEYRRAALQKYSDYVAANNDFPLQQFTGRHSSASEAIGYGKTMMLFHMLRLRAGDDAFVDALRRFYSTFRYERASFGDLARIFAEATGRHYQPFFDQWTARTGAPQLRLTDVVAMPAGGGYRLEFNLEQTQAGALYDLVVPVVITLDGVAHAQRTNVALSSRATRAKFALAERPLRVDIDPEFDLFRILAPDERPATFSQVFGARGVTIVVPARVPDDMEQAYRKAAAVWPNEHGVRATITTDSALDALPARGAVVILGATNRFRDDALRGAALMPDDAGDPEIGGRRLLDPGLTVATVTTQAARDHAPVMWLSAASPAALTGAIRKLPHYGKYSYTIFSGQAPDIADRGVWPVMSSSLSVVVPYEGENMATNPPRAPLSPRTALSEVPAGKNPPNRQPRD